MPGQWLSLASGVDENGDPIYPTAEISVDLPLNYGDAVEAPVRATIISKYLKEDAGGKVVRLGVQLREVLVGA